MIEEALRDLVRRELPNVRSRRDSFRRIVELQTNDPPGLGDKAGDISIYQKAAAWVDEAEKLVVR